MRRVQRSRKNFFYWSQSALDGEVQLLDGINELIRPKAQTLFQQRKVERKLSLIDSNANQLIVHERSRLEYSFLSTASSWRQTRDSLRINFTFYSIKLFTIYCKKKKNLRNNKQKCQRLKSLSPESIFLQKKKDFWEKSFFRRFSLLSVYKANGLWFLYEWLLNIIK